MKGRATSAEPRVGRGEAVATLIGLLLLAVNLRPAIGSVSPVLDDIRHGMGLSAGTVGLLTTLPVVCLGAFATAAPALARRFGAGVTLVGALALIVSGILVRLVPSVAALFVGTAMAGAGIAIGNVLMPYVVKRSFPHRIGLLTGISTMVLNAGAALAAGLTVPVRDAVGHGWRPALGVWSIPALLALGVWVLLARVRRDRPAAAERRPAGSLLRDALAWQVTTLMGLQSMVFYTILTWLPAVFHDHGYSAGTAGALLSVTMLLGVPASLAMPVLVTRTPYAVVALVVVLTGTGLAGLLAVPGGAWLWAVLLGLGQGGAFAVALTFIGLRAPDSATASRLSSMAQTIGYLVAGLGPFVIGLLHELSRGWTVPLDVLVALMLPELILGLLAARPRHVRPRGRRSPPVVSAPAGADHAPAPADE